MEAYRSHCPDCNRTYNWTGYKTGLGKTDAQLEAMERRRTVCKYCGGKNLQTDVDRDSEQGQAFGIGEQMVATLLGAMLNGQDTEEAMRNFKPKVSEVNIDELPLREPTKVNGEWFYKTVHSVFVLRMTDDTRFKPPEAAKMPTWVFYCLTPRKEE